VLAGERSVRKLFSKQQRAFYADHAPAGIGLDDLSVLGPIFVLKVRLAPPDLGRRLVGEMWLYPDGSRLLELSTRCAIGDAFQATAELRAFLAGHRVDVTGEQETKTRKALVDFAAGLRANGGRCAPAGSGVRSARASPPPSGDSPPARPSASTPATRSIWSAAPATRPSSCATAWWTSRRCCTWPRTAWSSGGRC
jgi:hypothetical protein